MSANKSVLFMQDGNQVHAYSKDKATLVALKPALHHHEPVQENCGGQHFGLHRITTALHHYKSAAASRLIQPNRAGTQRFLSAPISLHAADTMLSRLDRLQVGSSQNAGRG